MMVKVIEFNRDVLGIHPRPIGMLSSQESSHLHKCLVEEANELSDACRNGDLIGSIDALIDSVYFALGGLYKMGLTPELADEIFAVVHDANMTKRKGVIKSRATGAADAVKPENWVPPEERIGDLLDAHIEEGAGS